MFLFGYFIAALEMKSEKGPLSFGHVHFGKTSFTETMVIMSHKCAFPLIKDNKVYVDKVTNTNIKHNTSNKVNISKSPILEYFEFTKITFV